MKRFCLLLACLAICGLAREATAGWPGGWPHGWGSWYPVSNRGLPPYFSLYPPVYYSYPVPRTYGYSPFAYPPGTPTPDVQITPSPGPQILINPYVPSSKPAASQPAKTASGPLTIVNPFVEPKVAAASDAP